MAPAKDLQKLVMGVITPWRSSKEEPPFSGAEFLTMALIIKDKAMNDDDILDWIQSTFTYYRSVGWRDAWEAKKLNAESSFRDRSDKLQEFGAFHVPVTKDTNHYWNICINDARTYLQDKYGPKRAGTFTFLELPAEIRSVIYDMVLQYPPSGLHSFLNGDVVEIRTTNLAKPFSMDEWSKLYEWTRDPTYQLSMRDALSLLLVNKQMFEEAFPCFYRVNVFCFQSALTAYNFLTGTAPYRRQHVSQLAIAHNPWEVKYGKRLFDYLAAMPNLKKLYIDINESRWTKDYGPLIRGQIDILQIPGLEKLGRLRVEEVNFSSTCPTIAASLKAEMEGNATKKRNVAETDTVARESRSRAAKRGKKDYAEKLNLSY